MHEADALLLASIWRSADAARADIVAASQAYRRRNLSLDSRRTRSITRRRVSRARMRSLADCKDAAIMTVYDFECRRHAVEMYLGDIVYDLLTCALRAMADALLPAKVSLRRQPGGRKRG